MIPFFFDISWYQNSVKDDGGWTLERKHLDAPCSNKNNWSSSENINGGTSGFQNSIWTNENDVEAPFITGVTLISSDEVEVLLNETLDTSINYAVNVSPSLTSLEWNYASLNSLEIIANTFEINQLYTFTLTGVTDCWGNTSTLTFQIGLPDSIEPEDIIINEIMFNPLTNGSDYVELYNRSEKILDLNDLFLANWDDDSIANYEELINSQRLILPGQYVLLTEDSTDIQNDFAIYVIRTIS